MSLRNLSHCNVHGDFPADSPNDGHIKSADNFIVTFPGDSSERNCHGGSTVESPNDGHEQ